MGFSPARRPVREALSMNNDNTNDKSTIKLIIVMLIILLIVRISKGRKG